MMGGPFFPEVHRVAPAQSGARYDYVLKSGVTLRQYLAGQALQGCIASDRTHDNTTTQEDYARLAFKYADAMIKEGKK